MIPVLPYVYSGVSGTHTLANRVQLEIHARLHNETREREISDAANEFERDMADTMV